MRRVSVVVAAVAGLAVFPAGAAAAGFSLGVTAGEVTSGSAIVWAHATSSGTVGVRIARDKNFKRVVGTGSIKAKSSNDNTVQVQVRRLAADTTYYYRFSQGTKKSAKGTFHTAPASNKSKTIRFAFSGDEDSQPARGSSTPFYNTVGDRNFAVFNAMKRENNHFNINFGDTMYSDSEVGDRTFVNGVYQGFAPALSVKDKWAKYRRNLALANLQNLRGSAGMYNHWDDHEFINDFGPSETLVGSDTNGGRLNIPGSSVRGNGVKAFRDYMPVTYSSSNGIYRSVRWGKNLELFFLDERSFRSPKAGSPTIPTCNNPDTGAPDLAPTLPQPRRNFFAALSPSLAKPVSAACLAAINDPNRSMLGSRQYNAFTSAIKRSTATFKVIMNEVPIQEFFPLPYDRWEGYAAERVKLLTYLKNNVKNVIFLTTDWHSDLVNDARFTTFSEQGGAVPSGITEVVVGPVATMTAKREVNKALGQDPATGAGAPALDALIFDKPPDAGLGMRCSVIDTFSYGQVTVTSTKLTVEMKDQNRSTVREEEGTKPACPKIVLNKQ
jgi:phosphodiesterase/alkaline phosphatase D-like protein